MRARRASISASKAPGLAVSDSLDSSSILLSRSAIDYRSIYVQVRGHTFTDREHPTEGPIKTFKSPLDFEKTPVEFRRHAPRIGEDGPEVLREAGLSDADIAKLKADKTLIVPS